MKQKINKKLLGAQCFSNLAGDGLEDMLLISQSKILVSLVKDNSYSSLSKKSIGKNLKASNKINYIYSLYLLDGEMEYNLILNLFKSEENSSIKDYRLVVVKHMTEGLKKYNYKNYSEINYYNFYEELRNYSSLNGTGEVFVDKELFIDCTFKDLFIKDDKQTLFIFEGVRWVTLMNFFNYFGIILSKGTISLRGKASTNHFHIIFILVLIYNLDIKKITERL